MARYNPPTRVTTISMPYLAIVTRADPGFERYKHREVEYEFEAKMFLADPYVRGPYDWLEKLTTINYIGPATFNAGDLTGVGFDFVSVLSINSAPGTLTTRTASQMFSDISGATPGMQYILRISNTGEGGDLTLAPGVGVVFGNVVPIKNNTFSDYVVTFTDSSDLTIVSSSVGNPYFSISH